MKSRCYVLFTIIGATFVSLTPHNHLNALDQIVIKIATDVQQGTPQAKQLEGFKRYVTHESNNWIKVKIFTGGSLGNNSKLIERTVEGSIQIFAGSLDTLVTIIPSLNMLHAPFIFKSADHASRVLDGSVKRLVKSILPQHGLEFCMWTEYGFESWYTVHQPIKKPADLNGLKLLSNNRLDQQELYRLLEIVPVTLDIGDVATGLRNGTINGFSATPYDAVASSWYQEVRYLTLSKHLYRPGLVVYSKRWFDGLPENIKKILANIPNRFGIEARESVHSDSILLYKNLQEHGIEIYQLTAKDKRDFFKSVQRIPRLLISKTGRLGARIVHSIRQIR